MNESQRAHVALPGGRISAAALEALAVASEELADGFIEVTEHAAVTVNAVRSVDRLVGAVGAHELTVHRDHDRGHTILATPLAGRIGSAEPFDDHVDAVAAGLAAIGPAMVIGFDDGRGDIAARRPDILVWRGPAPDRRHEIRAAGQLVGTSEDPAQTVATIRAALIDIGSGDVATVDADSTVDERVLEDRRDPLIGWFDQDDGRVLLGGVVEAGRLSTRLARFLAAVNAPVIITPGREILLCDLDEPIAETVVKVLAPMGLIFDADAAW